MSFSRGPYATFTSLPSPERTRVVSARGIDSTTGRYQVEDDGAFTPMPGTAQRVLLAVAFDAGETPRAQSEPELEARQQRLAAAVAPLVEGARPAIAVNRIAVTATAPGDTTEIVDYRTLHADPDEVAEF